jgi:hypothetical protein
MRTKKPKSRNLVAVCSACPEREEASTTAGHDVWRLLRRRGWLHPSRPKVAMCPNCHKLERRGKREDAKQAAAPRTKAAKRTTKARTTRKAPAVKAAKGA